MLDQPAADSSQPVSLPLAEAGVLGQAVQRNELIFIPDTHTSTRFPPDPRWPHTRSRVIVPIPLGDRLLGVLDLHSEHVTKQTRQELVGLQSLAAQLGIAMHNAELYSQARRRAGQSRSGQPGQKRLPGQYEPRAAHARSTAFWATPRSSNGGR